MHCRFFAVLTPLLALCLSSGVVQGSATATDRAAAATYARLPLVFEENQGQIPAYASFVARGSGYRLLLSADQMSLTLLSGQRKGARPDVISIGMDGIAPDCRIQGDEELPGKANYFIGSDSSKWRTGVRTFGRVAYKGVYPGIDLIFYGNGHGLEYDLVLQPGADPDRIRFWLEGEMGARIEESGALRLSTSTGNIRFQPPQVYQDINGRRKKISGRFRLRNGQDGRKELTFAVEPYDRSRRLVIDPTLDYSTFLGGTGGDWAGAVAVDNAGNAYITGVTASLDFPATPDAVFPVHDGCTASCYDAFVAKINTTGKGLEYATYLGGSADDFGNAIAVDASGNAYVAGATNSTDFPTTGKALQRSFGGTSFDHDAFVTKLNPTGSALAYSTYLGGSGEDWGSGISVLNGNAYVSGFSASPDFPVTDGAYQTTMEGQGSSFVVKLKTDASAEAFGTFLGEVDLFDAGGAIVVDTRGNSYVAGITLSSNFPQTAGAFHTPFQLGLANNLYVLKLNASGTALAYSALIGGAGANNIAVDPGGNAYVSATAGTFFPVSPGAIDQSCDAGVLILKLNPTGSSLSTAAHLCPDRFWPVGVAVDAAHNIIFGAYSDATNLSTTVASMFPLKTSPCCFSDVVLGKLTADGGALSYLTYFGGKSGDSPNGLAQDSAGNVFLAGYSNSTSFPIKHALQTTNAGGGDSFLSEFSLPTNGISIWPANLAFSAEGIGNTSAAMDVTIANLSSSSLAFSGIVASGDFSVSSNGCGTELIPGARCVVGVTFTPQLGGLRTGLLTITDDSGAENVKLSGRGASVPVVAFSTANQINTAYGVTSPPFPITLTNVGTRALIITEMSLTGGGFNFGPTTNCFNPVAPLASCTVYVTYTGYGPGNTSLTFVDNGLATPQSFGLTGNVLGSGLVFTTSGLRFGQQVVGTSSAQQVALINGTTATVTISGIKASGNFTQTHTCKPTLAAGAFCYVNVTFKPLSKGIKQGTITVSSDASGSPLVFALLGTGD